MSECFDGGQCLHQECVLAPLALNIFYTAVLNTAEEKFRANPQVEAGLVSTHLIHLAMRDGDELPQTSTKWIMLYADDASIVFRSPASLAKMINVVVKVCGADGMTMPERKTETMIMRSSHYAQEGVEKMVSRLRYAENEEFVNLSGTITAEIDMIAEIRCRTGAAWGGFHRYIGVVYDRHTTTVPMP